LTHAVYSKMSPEVITQLVKHGANPNYQNESGGTALQTACVCKAPLEIIQSLLDNGADPHLANHHGNTPLIFAVRNHNSLEVVSLLAKLTGSEQINQQIHDDPKFPSYTALHFAAVEHLPAIAATLVKFGANTETKNGDGFTPLQLCDEKTKIAMMSAEHARDHKV
jgi:ankyrin repeat protein